MPFLILIPLATLAFGGGLKLAGDGIEDTGKGTRDLLIGFAAIGAVYIYAKSKKVI